MIIIGYQGIGKSTLASKNLKYIDLESSCMRVNGERADNWWEIYCNVAEELSCQGYIVFVSSHAVVRNRLKNSKEKIYVCYPSLELEDEWIRRLENRYYNTELDKDYRAWKNAEECYASNIQDLEQSGFTPIIILNMKYKLKDILPM